MENFIIIPCKSARKHIDLQNLIQKCINNYLRFSTHSLNQQRAPFTPSQLNYAQKLHNRVKSNNSK